MHSVKKIIGDLVEVNDNKGITVCQLHFSEACMQGLPYEAVCVQISTAQGDILLREIKTGLFDVCIFAPLVASQSRFTCAEAKLIAILGQTGKLEMLGEMAPCPECGHTQLTVFNAIFPSRVLKSLISKKLFMADKDEISFLMTRGLLTPLCNRILNMKRFPDRGYKV